MNPPRYFVAKSAKEVLYVQDHFDGDKIFLCTNRKTYEFCLNEGYRAVFLHDDMIKTDPLVINRWVMNQATALVQKFSKDDPRYLFLDANFYDVRALFIRVLKMALVLDMILNDIPSGDLYLFKGGPAWFSLTLEAYAHRLPRRLAIYFLPSIEKRAHRRFYPKTVFYRLAAFFINRFAELKFRLARRDSRKVLLASGALSHLAPVLECIRRRGNTTIVYVEERFNLEKCLYCLRRGILFYVLPVSSVIPASLLREPPYARGEIAYEGRDLGSFFNEIFNHLDKVEFVSRPFGPAEADECLSKFGVDTVLLDEDVAQRRVFSTISSLKQILCHVVSHGVPSVLVTEEVEPPPRHYRAVTTFVNSEFEKRAYETLLYEPARLVVTGTPRYDWIYRRNGAGRRASKLKNILYCGTGMAEYDFTEFSLITNSWGQKISREWLEESFRDLLLILAEIPRARMNVKPRYHGEESVWRELIQGSDARKRWRLLSHRTPILPLEALADLIITPISSVICEAIMLGKPAIILNYGRDSLAEPYTRKGLAIAVANRGELESAIKKCLFDGVYLDELRKNRAADGFYFMGPADGKNSQRAADLILP